MTALRALLSDRISAISADSSLQRASEYAASPRGARSSWSAVPLGAARAGWDIGASWFVSFVRILDPIARPCQAPAGGGAGGGEKPCQTPAGRLGRLRPMLEALREPRRAL